MNIFKESSGSEEEVSYRSTKKPFRRPIILRDFVTKQSKSPSPLLLKYKHCYSCKRPIQQDSDATVKVSGLEFHEECFTCLKCSKQLSGGNFREINGNFYCEADYKETFLPKCYTCTKYIHEVPVKLRDRNYHPLCFTCRKCSQAACPFTFKEKNGAIYDEDCYHRLFSPKCFNCEQPIKNPDEMTVALGTTFHRDHFVCFECAQPLPSKNFRQKNGELYCEKDYHRLFTTKCDKCNEPIIHRGVKALGKNWHADCCLRCEKCRKILTEGNYIGEKTGAYCHRDWLELFGPRCGAFDCQKPVKESLTGNAIVQLGRHWHPTCFLCKSCNIILNVESYYEYENEPFCYTCYHDLTCVDCLKAKEERERTRSKIIKSPVLISESERRSMSPISSIFKRTK